MLTFADMGGGGVPEGSNIADIIYEQPLTVLYFTKNPVKQEYKLNTGGQI